MGVGGWQPTPRAALALLAAAAAVALAALALDLGGDRPRLAVDPDRIAREAASADDPLDFSEERADALAARATLGTSHPIYAKSPDGVVASAERTARWRELVERAAERWEVDADTLEAMVLLESAGRPEVMADGTPHSATGLTQITPSAATELLGMRVDLARSAELTKRIARAAERGRTQLALRLARERRRVDERFRPDRALDGAARYLRIATDRFGSEELAVVSYHMGIGNLESVIADFTGADVGAERTAEVVDEHDLSYARLFFDSSPLEHEEAWRRLAGFGDDSALYLWRVRAAREIMRAWREDPEALSERAARITAKATLEEHYHPEEEAEVYEDADAIAEALDEGELVEIPDDPELGFRISEHVGELADELGVDPQLYRSLRPEALAALTHMAAKVKAISGAERPLRLTSAVRDRAYQEALVGENPEATSGYSLHTTGWAFDIQRDYANDAQAAAFQFVLDRMRAHALIDYAREPAAIHVTVSPLALELLE
jgi:soluble lytic murein transglycosylase-like protein